MQVEYKSKFYLPKSGTRASEDHPITVFSHHHDGQRLYVLNDFVGLLWAVGVPRNVLVLNIKVHAIPCKLRLLDAVDEIDFGSNVLAFPGQEIDDFGAFCLPTFELLPV